MATRLRSLSLTSLVQLGGGDVIIAGNTDLCYVNSVNWTSLRIGDKSGRTFIRGNRDPALCGQYHSLVIRKSNLEQESCAIADRQTDGQQHAIARPRFAL